MLKLKSQNHNSNPKTNIKYIVEAKASSSRRDFIKFYEIALKSANETKYWLCLLRDGVKADKIKIEIHLTF